MHHRRTGRQPPAKGGRLRRTDSVLEPVPPKPVSGFKALNRCDLFHLLLVRYELGLTSHRQTRRV